MNKSEQMFLKELNEKLWSATYRLSSDFDPADYKHVVLALIFLKHISEAFEAHRQDLRRLFTQDDRENNICFMPRKYYDSDKEYRDAVNAELELHDHYHYHGNNVVWVPKQSRWEFLKSTVALPIGTDLTIDEPNGEKAAFKLSSISKLIDNALSAIESYKIDGKLANPKLNGVLPRISRYKVNNRNLAALVNIFSCTSFNSPEYNGEKLDLHSKDIFGHVYEHFLEQFTLLENRLGGRDCTPKSIATLIVEILQPYHGRVYDPMMGVGGFFVSNDKAIEAREAGKHFNASEQRKPISIYGQESDPATYKLAVMNMVIRGMDFDFGKKHADIFLDDQHLYLRADFAMANPPFNERGWWHPKLESDPRWKYGKPPQSNGNYGCIQHMLHHLNCNGSMGLVLAPTSMYSTLDNQGKIRKELVEADLVECMITLPGHLFTYTQIPSCIWFLTKNKKGGNGKRDRRGETLFIDASRLGFMKTRMLRDLTHDDIAKIVDVFHDWQMSTSYQNKKGFCYSANLEEIQNHDYVLTPTRYISAPEAKKNNEPYTEKMQRLTDQLKHQLEESKQLERSLKDNLSSIGYDF